MIINNIERHKDLILIKNIKLRQISKSKLIDMELKDMSYSFSHGVGKNNTLDSIFSLVKLIKSKVCVVIGTGCGLIPRIIREAQLASSTSDSKTYLIDLGENIGG